MEELAAVEENTRITITISPYDYRKLKKWARIHGKTPAAYAAQIIAARLESNTDLINQQFAEIAEYEETSVKELEARWESEE